MDIKELMFKAFKEGQKRFKAEDYPIKLWIADEIDKTPHYFVDDVNPMVDTFTDSTDEEIDERLIELGINLNKLDAQLIKEESYEN